MISFLKSQPARNSNHEKRDSSRICSTFQNPRGQLQLGLLPEVEQRVTVRVAAAIVRWLEAKHGAPGEVPLDGTEFIARRVHDSCAKVKPSYIAPGSPRERDPRRDPGPHSD
jgi:hypothetical protein